MEAHQPAAVESVEGRVLIIRSGPWPVLRALLARLVASGASGPITILCHRRDESNLATLGSEFGLEIEPLFYPRFEPFNTSTLRRLLTGGDWDMAIVLDASRSGRGESLEHVTTAFSSRESHVWNAGGVLWQHKCLRDRLPAETYALVRGLLRWRARHEAM